MNFKPRSASVMLHGLASDDTIADDCSVISPVMLMEHLSKMIKNDGNR